MDDALLKIIERELLDVQYHAAKLSADDIQSRAHDLLHKLRTKLDDRIVWLVYENDAGDGELMYIASTEDQATEWLRANTSATERAAFGFDRKYSLTAHQVDG